MNIPVNSDIGFLDDLFKSRFTKYVKGRIVVDPTPDPLRTGTIKKIAFVELNSFADQSRVLKWQDLVYRGTRRMSIELADFNDFQNCMSFNQTHERELEEAERNNSSGRHERSDNFPLRHRPEGRTGGGMPLDSISLPTPRYQLHTRRLSQETQPKLVPPPTPKTAPHPKPNPFGLAKPVDIVAHQLENEKKMIVINNTTIKTVGNITESAESGKVSSMTELRSKTAEEAKPTEEVFLSSNQSGVTKKFTAAPIPESIYGQKKSLAHLLSNPGDGTGTAASSQRGRSSPQVAVKTTILKKTHPETSPSVNAVVDIKATEPTEEVATPKDQTSHDSSSRSVETSNISPASNSKDSAKAPKDIVVDQHRQAPLGNNRKHDKHDGRVKHRDRRQLTDEKKSRTFSSSQREHIKLEESKTTHGKERQLNVKSETALSNNSPHGKPRRRQSGAGPEDSNSGTHSLKPRNSSIKAAERPRRVSIAENDRGSAINHSDPVKVKSKPNVEKFSNDNNKKATVLPAKADANSKADVEHSGPTRRRASHPKGKNHPPLSKETNDGKSKDLKPESKAIESQNSLESNSAESERGEPHAESHGHSESARGRGRGRGRGRRSSTGRGPRRGRGGHQRSDSNGHDASRVDKTEVVVSSGAN